MDELEKAFTHLNESEVWQSNLTDTMRNECLNFAHRILAEVVRLNADETLEKRTEEVDKMTKAILESFKTLNSLQRK